MSKRTITLPPAGMPMSCSRMPSAQTICPASVYSPNAADAPNAASSVGLSVTKYKYIALMLGGALAGLGGAFMSMYYSQSWNVNMVAGRGFIALAAEAMGNHTPLGAMLSSLLFGLAQAVSIKVAGLGLSSDIVSAIPYAITIIGLAAYAAARIHSAKKARRRLSA